ncbi:D-alanyl-D-alanine dipeptidase [Streptomyces sp. 3MP-14]|uniref:D-alanyl-D-alanine dipeptidase n=1 Tax=Streptomyces mimosae TaxID=2586635 RepID=A0A5N6A2Q6_9ACTN|nr:MULTISPECIES: M15 family metallopeptidase [Streptomyces]KAB8161970.1 D-alanyl-D-alanine dipeptidase [Streptomyces mimosae]KAB8173668.1 D-alanyl-D-alanine dipeptidase [Streptomyces sp. 3MP-14]
MGFLRRPARVVTAGLAAGVLAALAGSVAPARAPEETERAPAGFAALRAVAPGIDQDIRYAGDHNFVGERIDGYEEPECLLAEETARALARVERDLARDGLGLRVFDCYRPQRAVDHFLRWAEEPGADERRAEFYPRVPKDRLFDEGYLAERSGHSRGGTVDLTLVDDEGRAVDMGTGFDFFDPASHPDSPEPDADQRRARERLRSAMAARGFTPIDTEWWHFTHDEEPFPDRHFDFPVERAALREE